MSPKVQKISTLILVTLLIVGIYEVPKNRATAKYIADALDNLSHIEFYQALANPSVRYIKVAQGTRKEEIESALDDKLGWDTMDSKDFLGHDEFRRTKFEGEYYPDVYLVPKDASGKDVRDIMLNRFENEFEKIKGTVSTSTTDKEEILTIASIIQREAAGKSDMNLISGIIWNRIDRGMPLQMDATLQYVKGSEDEGWWPVVQKDDKNIKSPYNTYKNKGLPPSPIANPGLEAITAAMNPQKTSCLYYLHSKRQIYCSKTYVEHKAKIEKYLK
jgi:UPF0755 protein